MRAIMLRNFNPFFAFYYKESARHIHARTLRSSFLGKIQDTFNVLSGSPVGHFKSLFKYDNFYIPYGSLLDYPTFFIPWVIGRIFRWSMGVFIVKSLLPPSVLMYIIAGIVIVPAFILTVADLL